ncbi:MAG: 2-oxoacid:acceptor oxidoreductase family protein [Firmicutes bacterium]|nr:2-oxoacid:acceptor oxidoreductase family protein [Bacillota bacterium]
MGEMLEIRWHGRGGQGAKTAAILLAEAAAASGKYVQAFPEYGPERSGAPVVAYNRISDEPISLHSSVTNPRYVVVLDPTLAGKIDLAAGIPEGGIILVNSSHPPGRVRELLGLPGNSIKLFAIDASKISVETIGRSIPNTPMLGALIRATGVLDLEELLEDTRKKLEKKFKDKPKIIEGNMSAIRRAYEEVQAE